MPGIINIDYKKDLQVRRFGYLLSGMILVFTVIAMVMESTMLPWLFLILMYFVTGSLWLTGLIKPFYILFGKRLFPTNNSNEIIEKKETEHINHSAQDKDV